MLQDVLSKSSDARQIDETWAMDFELKATDVIEALLGTGRLAGQAPGKTSWRDRAFDS